MNAVKPFLRYPVKYSLVAALLLALVAWRLNHIYLNDPRDHNASASQNCYYEDECLFNRALNLGLIQENKGQLLLTAPDALFNQQQKEHPYALEHLYYSPPGKIVRAEIKRWNNSRVIAAVRAKIITDSGTTTPLPESTWHGNQLLNLGDQLKPYPLPLQNHIPVDFGYVHGGELQTGFPLWAAAPGNTEPVEFKASINLLTAGTLDIQYIGQWQASVVQISGQKAQVIGGDVITPLCNPLDRQQSEKVCHINVAPAGKIKLNLSAHQYPTQLNLSITVRPSHNETNNIDGLRITKNEQGRYQWSTLVTSGAQTGVNFRFLSAFPHYVLNTQQGEANACAEQLGLIPLLGIDRSFSFSLNGLFAQSRMSANTDIYLSIDPLLQYHSHELLKTALNRRAQEGPRHKDVLVSRAQEAPPWLSALRNLLDKDFDQERRAALVVIDADKGDILAASSWPVLPPLTSFTPWDIKSFHKIYEKKSHTSPLEIQAWQNLNRDNTPGSIFKPLVAAAAATAVNQEDNYIKALINGFELVQWNRKILEWDHKTERLPLSNRGLPRTGDSQFRPVPHKFKSIANFKDDPLSKHFYKGRLGLKEAMQNSSNLWFLKLIMELDGVNAAIIDDTLDRLRRQKTSPSLDELQQTIADLLTKHPIQLRETMLKFGFDKPLKLVDLKQLTGISWPENAQIFRLLSTQASSANISNHRALAVDPLQFALAQSAIGQAGVQITPLHAALIFASINNNAVIQPQLITRVNDNSLQTPPTDSLGINPEVLQSIRAGLKAVTDFGTAAGSFARQKHSDTPITYGKTGTAEVKLEVAKVLLIDTKSVWFVGWREPKVDTTERPEHRRLAFACMVTHSTGTGGGVCAPLIAEFLRRINQLSHPSLPGCTTAPVVNPDATPGISGHGV